MNGHCDWFILPLQFRFRLRQSGFQVIVNDGVTNGVRREWKRSDSSDSDSVAGSAYDSHFCFSLSHKLSYDSDASENQPLCGGYTFFGGGVKFKKINVNETNKSTLWRDEL